MTNTIAIEMAKFELSDLRFPILPKFMLISDKLSFIDKLMIETMEVLSAVEKIFPILIIKIDNKNKKIEKCKKLIPRIVIKNGLKITPLS